MFEVIGKANRSGEILHVFRELDNNGGTITGTEFVLGVNNVLVDYCDYDVSKPQSYRHVTVVNVDYDGAYDIEDMPYKCEPLPEKSGNWLVLRHPSGKDWAINEDNDGQLMSLFKNEHTSGRWIYKTLDHSVSKAKRIQSKRDKGYDLISTSTKTWKSASKAFSK